MHNNHFLQFLNGNARIRFQSVYLNRSGYVREGGLVGMQMPMVGYPGASKIPNPRRMEKCSLGIVKKPHDAAGSALMTWRYLDPDKEDNSFGYSPAIRRVRRMSSGNRSDALWGSHFAVDDSGGFDGKVTAFSYKYLGKQEALLPILDVDLARIVRNDRGEWETTSSIKPVIYGYQKKGWQGAAWAPTNLCWIKRWVYVLEMHSKDRYYNYGKQYLWISADTYSCAYKVIHDRPGDYWKTLFIAGVPCESDDKSMRLLTRSFPTDDRRPEGPIGGTPGLHAAEHMDFLCRVGSQLLHSGGIPEVVQVDTIGLESLLGAVVGAEEGVRNEGKQEYEADDRFSLVLLPGGLRSGPECPGRGD